MTNDNVYSPVLEDCYRVIVNETIRIIIIEFEITKDAQGKLMQGSTTSLSIRNLKNIYKYMLRTNCEQSIFLHTTYSVLFTNSKGRGYNLGIDS